MVDVAFIGINTVIDNGYRRKIKLVMSGLFLAVSAATAVWFIFPGSQNVLAPFLLPAIFLLLTLSMGYYTFLFGCEKKYVVENVLGMVEPAESVKRVRCQDEIESLLAETRDITKSKFCNVLINLCFEDRSKAHKLALYVRDIDSVASSIKDEDLLNHFDQFFTITEASNKNIRNELINRARIYRTISEKPKNEIQSFLDNQKESLSYEIMSPKIDNFLLQAGMVTV
ncbi:hypothetical protein [Wolbachia endosymbiont (group B) of Germaria angustata]|uniref:hypothetical protein n=1 Tax=Wolbachia endosymbiont (group B) of Germaria angustata TaxID=3077916 RepID=UPI003132A461